MPTPVPGLVSAYDLAELYRLVNLLSGCRISYYNGLAVLPRYDVMRGTRTRPASASRRTW